MILQAAEGAVLTFDEPVNLARGQIGHLARGSLPGAVTIRSPESRPGAADQLEVVTHNVQMTRDRIEAPQPIQFRYGKSYGSGRDLIIYLATAGGSGPPEAACRVEEPRCRRCPPPNSCTSTASACNWTIPGSSLRPPGQAKDRPAAPSLQLEITCQGPFKFDFAGKLATFEDQVDVLRVPTGGPVDQLSCQRLSIFFAKPGASGTTAAKAASAAELTPRPICRDCKSNASRPRDRRPSCGLPRTPRRCGPKLFEYNFLTRQVRIEDRQKLLLRYQQYDIEVRQLEYQFAAGGTAGPLAGARSGPRVRDAARQPDVRTSRTRPSKPPGTTA